MKKCMYKGFLNRIYQILAMYLPGANTVRPFLHRLRGVIIHGRIFIAEQVYIENEYPECVEIGNETQIGIRTIIIAHFRGPGKIVIGEKVWIGPNCVISTSVGRTLTIGAGAVVGASSVVTSDIPPGIFVAPQSAQPIAKATIPWTGKTAYKDFIKGLIPLRKGKNK
jgi:acetyltransferase-like isoleucine patch superfamily enzyme